MGGEDTGLSSILVLVHNIKLERIPLFFKFKEGEVEYITRLQAHIPKLMAPQFLPEPTTDHQTGEGGDVTGSPIHPTQPLTLPVIVPRLSGNNLLPPSFLASSGPPILHSNNWVQNPNPLAVIQLIQTDETPAFSASNHSAHRVTDPMIPPTPLFSPSLNIQTPSMPYLAASEKSPSLFLSTSASNPQQTGRDFCNPFPQNINDQQRLNHRMARSNSCPHLRQVPLRNHILGERDICQASCSEDEASFAQENAIPEERLSEVEEEVDRRSRFPSPTPSHKRFFHQTAELGEKMGMSSISPQDF